MKPSIPVFVAIVGALFSGGALWTANSASAETPLPGDASSGAVSEGDAANGASKPDSGWVLAPFGAKRTVRAALRGGAIEVQFCATAAPCLPEAATIKAPRRATLGPIELVTRGQIVLLRSGNLELLLTEVEGRVRVLHNGGFPQEVGRSRVSVSPSTFVVERLASTCSRDVVVRRQVWDARKATSREEPASDPFGREQSQAKVVIAPAPQVGFELFRVIEATHPEAARLVDGDPATAWEASGLSVATFAGPKDVPISGVDVTVGPSEVDATLLIMTESATLTATIPPSSDAAPRSLSIPLGPERAVRCVSIATLPGKRDPKKKAGAPTLRAVTAHSPWVGKSPSELAAALRTDDAHLTELSALLEALGRPGLEASAAAYGPADPPHRARLLRVIDRFDCDARVAAFYVPELIASDRERSERARLGLRGCGKSAAPRLIGAMTATQNLDQKETYAVEAALLDPAIAVPVLFAELTAAPDDEHRRRVRSALAKAASRQGSVPAFDRIFSDPAFSAWPIQVAYDLFRALGPAIAESEPAATRFEAMAVPEEDFDHRFFGLRIAAEGAKASRPASTALLLAGLASSDPRIRAEAARVSAGVASVHAELLKRLADEAPRVREAALEAFVRGEKQAEGRDGAVALLGDPWAFVRLAALDLLRSTGGHPAHDEKLAALIPNEVVPAVRAEALRVLAAHRAVSALPVVRARAFDAKESTLVRREAIAALGELCDREASSDLFELLRRAEMPSVEQDRILGAPALTALFRLNPPTLTEEIERIKNARAVPELLEAIHRGARSPRCP